MSLIFMSLLVLLSLSLAGAGERASKSDQAVLTLGAGEVYDGRGVTIRCDGMQRVGVRADHASVRHLRIEGCDVGIEVIGKDSRVDHVQVSRAGIGFLLGGCCADVTNNIALDADYAFAVTGSFYQMTGNQAFTSGYGYFIAGHGNVLKENRAAQNSIGIAVVNRVPAIENPDTKRRDLRSVFALNEHARGNSMDSNTFQDNGLDMYERTLLCEENEWIGNTFDTKDPACLQVPPPDEE